MADIIYDTQEAVPEDLRDAATAKDGKFVVSVAPQAKLTEFRDNNLRLSQERDSAKGILAKVQTEFGYDPEKHDEFKTTFEHLRDTAKQVEDGKLIKDTSLEEAVTKRTGEMQTAHKTQLTALETANNNYKTENEQLKERIHIMEVDNVIGLAAIDKRSGVRSDAINAVKREARDVFKMRDGKLVPLDADNQIIYGADGASPMTPLEWIKTKLTTTAPYLFEASAGGGAGGGSGPTDGNIPANLPPAERMRLAREQQQGR